MTPSGHDSEAVADFFYARRAAAAATLGLGALGMWLYARARSGPAWLKHADALLDPLALTALLSFLVAYVLILNPPGTSAALRNLVLTTCVALSLYSSRLSSELSRIWQQTGRGRSAPVCAGNSEYLR
jgi:hypothetical protein